jgi:hydroxymethylpyrimidine pyrophosphatase-like HAD family hydrolase
MALAHQQNCAVDVVTGNSSEGLISKLKAAHLPYPQVISSLVGTEIKYLQGYDQNGEPIYEADSAYQRMVQESGFDKKQVITSSQRTIAEFSNIHPNWKLDFQKEPLVPDQTDPEPHKLSFYFYSQPTELQAATAEIRENFPGNEVVTCGEIGYNEQHKGEPVQKYCVDVLPVTKNTAMKYLGAISKLKAGNDSYLEFVLKLGDSGNDTFLGEATDENELSVLAGGATFEAKSLADLITKPEDSQRSFRHVRSLSNESGPTDRAFYSEQKPSVVATQSLIRSGRMALLGALRHPSISSQAKEYLGTLYKGLTSIEKSE